MKQLTREEKNRERNKKYKTLVKNDLKNFTRVLNSKEGEERVLSAKNLLKVAQSNIHKSSRLRVINKNNASRKISKLFKLFNSLKENSK